MNWTTLLTIFVCFLRLVRSIDWSFLNFLDIEMCNDHYIPRDMKLLKKKLMSDLYGQHIVEQNLLPILISHYSQKDPQKALSISFHGWTGSGKNHVSKMIAESTYRLGMRSKFVHFFSGRLHFPLNSEDAVEQYKMNLQTWIRGNVSQCGRSMFIFDEIDRINPFVVEAIKPYLDFNPVIDSVDYRRSVFIFLTNLGGNVINHVYNELWNSGLPREKMMYKSFETPLRKYLYNNAGAFEKSDLLEHHLISMYLPFLPLERVHVVKCIKAEFERELLQFSDEQVMEVLQQMEFYDNKYSISGCKRVNDLVAVYKYKKTEL